MIDSNVSQYLEILLNIAFVVLPTLAALALMLPTGAFVAKTLIAGWQWFRPNVDDVNDSFVQMLAKHTGRTPEEVLQMLTYNLDKLITILKEAQPKAEK